MYTYQVTYHFEKEKKRDGEYVNRPIADAFDSFLDSKEIQAERDGTTSTAYFRFGGDIKSLKNFLFNFFQKREKETKKKISFAKKDVIAVICFQCSYDTWIINSKARIKNGKLYKFPKKVELLFKTFPQIAIDNIEGQS